MIVNIMTLEEAAVDRRKTFPKPFNISTNLQKPVVELVEEQEGK